MPRRADQLSDLSDAAQMLDLGAQVEPGTSRCLHGLGESPSGDPLLDCLMRDAPLAGEIRGCDESAGLVYRAQGGLHGVGHAADGIAEGCVLTTPTKVGSIQPMETTATTDIQPGDVIRARRIGNRTVGNYTIDRVARFQHDGIFCAYAHRQYSQAQDTFMSFDATTIRIVQNYR